MRVALIKRVIRLLYKKNPQQHSPKTQEQKQKRQSCHPIPLSKKERKGTYESLSLKLSLLPPPRLYPAMTSRLPLSRCWC